MRLAHRWIAVVRMGLLAAFLLGCVSVGAVGQVEVVGAGGAVASASREAWKLAGEGRFDEGIERVRSLVTDAEEGSPLATLQRDLATLEAHRKRRADESRTSHDTKLAEAREHFEKGDLIEAFNAVLWAQDLASDPAAMVSLPLVQELTGAARDQATEYESQGNWLRALPLYARLGALYEEVDRERYLKPLRRVASRVGHLRMYAPKTLYGMYVKLAQEDGDDAPEAWAFEGIGWEEQVSGADLDILIEGIHYASQAHVEGTNYETLLRGGLEMLNVFATTSGLEATFPTLGDVTAREKFLEGLDHLRKLIDTRQRPMRDTDAVNLINRVIALNSQSLRLPDTVVVREFGDGAMQGLDEFSGMIWPHEKARFERTTTQRFTGVGIQISMIERGRSSAPAGVADTVASTRHQLTVITPLEGSPALAAGIRPGDRIVAIDGKSSAGIDIDTAVEKITGPEGTTVTLSIERPNGDRRDVPLKRESIPIASVRGWSRSIGGEWDYYVDPALHIGYVRLSQFGPDSATELDAAVNTMLDGQGLNGLILDLRNNPGGRLDAAIDVADRFIDAGNIVSVTGSRIGADASRLKTFPGFPLIVLINGRSASASEIVSGAIKDHERGLIVGERTFGKGSVQNVYPVGRSPFGSREKPALLKLTTQYYKLPDGSIIHRRPQSPTWGVDPDVAVRMSDRQEVKAARARTLLDILRTDGEEIDPNQVLSGQSDDDEDNRLPPITNADDILSSGLDPQLETALLLMKTKVIGDLQG